MSWDREVSGKILRGDDQELDFGDTKQLEIKAGGQRRSLSWWYKQSHLCTRGFFKAMTANEMMKEGRAGKEKNSKEQAGSSLREQQRGEEECMPAKVTEWDLLVKRGDNPNKVYLMSQMKVFKEGKSNKLYQLCCLGSRKFHFTAFLQLLVSSKEGEMGTIPHFWEIKKKKEFQRCNHTSKTDNCKWETWKVVPRDTV